ncbi:MAG: TIGR02996 domain-containing protein, partial [Myxococcales bacterium]|nr:TIGR02996 domain-containing protein [Myxococcales bacterium]
YADWLQERGHPRAELIRIQLALESTPNDPTLLQRESALLHAHGESLIGPFVRWMRRPDDREALTWRRGFVDGALLNSRGDLSAPLQALLESHAAQHLRWLGLGTTPRGSVTPTPVADTLRRLLATTSLRRLDLDDSFAGELTNQQWEDLLQAGLRHLGLREHVSEPTLAHLAKARNIDTLQSLTVTDRPHAPQRDLTLRQRMAHLRAGEQGTDPMLPPHLLYLQETDTLHHVALTVLTADMPERVKPNLGALTLRYADLTVHREPRWPTTMRDRRTLDQPVPCPNCHHPQRCVRSLGDVWVCEQCGRSFPPKA